MTDEPRRDRPRPRPVPRRSNPHGATPAPANNDPDWSTPELHDRRRAPDSPPEPAPDPDVGSGPEAVPDPDVEVAAEAGPAAEVQPAGPVPMPQPFRVRRARPGFVARGVQAVAILSVAAGVTVFVVARTGDRSTAAPSSSSSTAAARTQDDRALITDSSRDDAFLAAASTEVVTVTESDYRRLDDALSAGLSVTTGDFRSRYRAALTGDSAQTRRANHSTTSIDVLNAGIGQISQAGAQASVLIFARVHQTGDDIDAASADALVTLNLTMVRDGGQILISNLEQGTNAGLPPGTAGLRAAAEAARSEVIATLSYSRSSFADDLTRALDGSTGSLRSQLTSGSAGLKTALTKGKYDLEGAVTAVAVEQANAETASILVAATGSRLPDTGSPSVSTDARYVVAVQRVSGTWLVSSLTPAGG